MRNFLIAGALIVTLSSSPLATDEPIAPNWSLTAADDQVVRPRDVVQPQTTVLLFGAAEIRKNTNAAIEVP